MPQVKRLQRHGVLAFSRSALQPTADCLAILPNVERRLGRVVSLSYVVIWNDLP